MTSRALAVLAAASALCACNRPAPPPPAQIGGISIGMSMESYRAVALSPPGFSIGGVTGVPSASFENGKLEHFDWHFRTSQYYAVRGALMTQYPQLKCETALGFETCTVQRTVFLAEGQRGGTNSHVWLQRRRD